MAVLGGCDRRTPDERLATAVQFYQQGDAASAELEAQKVVEKAPEDPAGVQASLLLAQIYSQQNRMEEAEIQLKSSLDNLSQLDPMGKDALRMYLGMLAAQKKFDQALEVVDQVQEEYAEDPGTSLSLRVVRADIMTEAGDTSGARDHLQDIIDETTGTAELALYRDLYLKTFYRDEDTTGALEFLQGELEKVSELEEQVPMLGLMAQISAGGGDYDRSRGYQEELTGMVMADMRQEPSRISRAAKALHLGQIYMTSDNLPGANRVFESLYGMSLEEPEAVQGVVNHLMETQIRLGETSAVQSMLQEVSEKYPDGPYKDVLARMEELIASGRLHEVAPEDTSTLVMRYRGEAEVLWPADLPEVLAVPDGQVPGQGEADTQAVDEETTGAEAVSEEPAAPVEIPVEADGVTEGAVPGEAEVTEPAPAEVTPVVAAPAESTPEAVEPADVAPDAQAEESAPEGAPSE